MAEILEESQGLESTTIGIYRTAATVKGGRRFSFGALVVVGDRRGRVGLGYGKAPSVPAAIEKAQKGAKKHMEQVTLQEGTIPHQVTARFLASEVKLIPASPGTGVIAGGTVRAVLEMAGVRDCLTKAMGSTNQKNLAKAAFNGLLALRSKETIAALRGVDVGKTEVEDKLERGQRFAPTPVAEPAAAPTAKPDNKGKNKNKGAGKGKAEAEPATGTAPEAPAAQPTEPAAEEPKAEDTSAGGEGQGGESGGTSGEQQQ